MEPVGTAFDGCKLFLVLCSIVQRVNKNFLGGVYTTRIHVEMWSALHDL